MICYFFYKNIAFGFTLFFFEAYASFSGQTAYNDWYMSFYNVIFTSIPVVALGILEQDVSTELCLKSSQFPLLYQEGVQNVLFSWFQFLGWAFNGVLNAILIFFFCSRALEHPAFHKGGEVAELEILGIVMYTGIVWVVNCQIALSTNYFTLKNHFYIWGSIISWYIFLLAYGAMISTTACKVFIEACAPAPSYWLLTLFVVITSLIPYFTYKSIQLWFFPMYHQMIQWISKDGQSDDPEYCQMVRQRSLRPMTVGYLVHLEATSKRFQEMHEVHL